MKYYSRNTYLLQIEPFIDKPLIKVLSGQRRVGKSYLLLQIIDYIKENIKDCNIISVNKEDLEFDFIHNYQQLYDYILSKSTPGKNYVFIDEIQEITDFHKAIRSLLQKGNYDIYCTGSNADILAGDIANTLSGRYIEFKIYGLSYIEFLQFHEIENNQQSLNRYLSHGGLPFLIHLPNTDKVVYEYLKNIYNTIYFKDVVSRYNIRNVSFLTDLTKYIANNCGSIFSAHTIAKYLKSQQIKVSYDVITNYLSYLESAHFVHRVKRMELTGKKIFEIGEKVFFEDIGLRNSIAGYKADDIGKVMENVVYKQLLIWGYEVFVGVNRSMEIDFVAIKENERIYVQVAYLLKDTETIEREFGNLLKIKDNFPKYVISMDNIETPNTYKGVISMNLADFLTMKN